MGTLKHRPLTAARKRQIASAAARILSDRNIRDMERRYQALSMRRDGHTIKDIADALGTGTDLIRKDLIFILNLTSKELMESSEEQRQLQNERLDLLTRTFVPLATEPNKIVITNKQTGESEIVDVPPDPKYAQVLLSTLQRQAKLNALDVPEVKKLDVTGIREYVGIDVDAV